MERVCWALQILTVVTGASGDAQWSRPNFKSSAGYWSHYFFWVCGLLRSLLTAGLSCLVVCQSTEAWWWGSKLLQLWNGNKGGAGEAEKWHRAVKFVNIDCMWLCVCYINVKIRVMIVFLLFILYFLGILVFVCAICAVKSKHQRCLHK